MSNPPFKSITRPRGTFISEETSGLLHFLSAGVVLFVSLPSYFYTRIFFFGIVRVAILGAGLKKNQEDPKTCFPVSPRGQISRL